MTTDTFLKNWKITPKKEGGGPEYHVTERVARNILNTWRNNPNAEIVEMDKFAHERLVGVVNRNDYRAQPIEPDKVAGSKKWLCGYGTLHEMREGCYTDDAGNKQWSATECGCKEKYGVQENLFLKWINTFFKVERSHQITPFMQKEFLKTNKPKS